MLFASKLLFWTRLEPGGAVGVEVEVLVGVAVAVLVAVGIGVLVAVAVGEGVLVAVGDGVAVLVAVGVGVGMPPEVKKLAMTCPRLSTGAGRPIEYI
jgi:Na+-translocating ferredoxin:NAD+ oxidoreductase RnfD subunit